MPDTPVNTSMPRENDLKRTIDLKEALKPFNVFEDDSDSLLRTVVLNKLEVLLKEWIKNLSIKNNMPKEQALKLGGKIKPFGSYRLGVHQKGADIDALCLAPRNISREEFFGSFLRLLKTQNEVSECRGIEDAFVPVIKLKYHRIEVDLLFARMALKEIADDIDLSNDMLLKNLDKKCVRSLNGSRVTEEILRLVPNLENFQLALRGIKLWAKSKW